MPREKRKRQTRLEFSPLPPSSPASAAYNEQIRERAAAVGYHGANQSKRRKFVDFFNSSDHSGLSKPSASQGSSQSMYDTITVNVDKDSDSDSLPDLPPTRPSKKNKARHSSSQARGSSPTTPQGTNFFRKQESRSSLRRTTRKTKRAQNLDSDDDEPKLPSSSRKASDNFVNLGSAEDDSEESDVPRASARKRQKTASTASTPLEVSSEDEDDIPQSSRRRLRGRTETKEKPVVELSSDSESAESTPRPRSSAHQEPKSEEQQELEDDLKDLETSGSDKEPPQSTQRRRVKSERELALERIRRRRAGMSDEPEPEEVSSDESEASGSDEVDEAPVPSSSAKDMFHADEYDEDFLIDDGDDTLGAPDGVPLEFTRYAAMKPKELFRFAIEWMVQKKLNPGFNRDDEIYKLTFSKLNDEVKGLAGSKFESAAWKTDFLFTLRARPQFVGSKMSKHDRETAFLAKCDACNRSGHTPSYELQFQGRPYHVSSLEDVDDPEDSDSDAEAAGNRDASGRVVFPEDHSFFVGRFCMANAETAHALQHWKYHLYEWVVEHLEGEGILAPEGIVKRDGWGEPRRRKFANKVLDGMVEGGVVKKLWRDFKGEVEKARQAKQWVRGESP